MDADRSDEVFTLKLKLQCGGKYSCLYIALDEVVAVCNSDTSNDVLLYIKSLREPFYLEMSKDEFQTVMKKLEDARK